ncbi:hypothetical protein [Nissabacter sp. SGAir0207]|uniref:hypothetical protein n=1 Tax=Nissabacter sp. SGAir0207 TaxID=2126321 RepID=UPI0010CD40C4|nr:hypothetical protein [Nissabacter sp. SGAir0207]QCR36473.1 hypothetical protein C1N62_10360 [Nissabacter sp. SGAir0207]
MSIGVHSLVKHKTGNIIGRVISLLSRQDKPWAMVDWGNSGISMHAVSDLIEVTQENRRS